METIIELAAVAVIIVGLLSIGFAWGWNERAKRPDWGQYELKPKNPRQL